MTTGKPKTPMIKIDPDSPKWMRLLAMLAGGLAAVAGYLTIRNTILANESIYHSTQAVLFQDKASDSWSEYQAQSTKARVCEVGMLTTTDASAKAELQKEDDQFRQTQPAVKQQAVDFETQRDNEIAESNHLLKERDILQYASMAIQLGIALASIAALTKRIPLFIVGAVTGLLGVGITAFALYIHFFANA